MYANLLIYLKLLESFILGVAFLFFLKKYFGAL